MFKLVILIEPEVDQEAFLKGWPDFLKLAEQMPGYVRAVAAPVHQRLYGRYEVLMVHEFLFETLEALTKAMESPTGAAAGKTLQQITGGKFTLLIAAHLEDNADKLRKYRLSRKQPG